MGLVPRDQIQRARAFRLPSFDPRLNSGASFGLRFEDLRGDERVRLEGLTPEGWLDFSLPGDVPQIGLDAGEGEQSLAARLQTVFILPEARRVDLIWRGSLDIAGIDWLATRTRLRPEAV